MIFMEVLCLSRNNNNAGIHFTHHSNYGKYEDLSYYNKHSVEGLRNKRYEIIARLEELGEYEFTKFVSTAKVVYKGKIYDSIRSYKVMVYDSQFEKELDRVSKVKKLVEDGNLTNNGNTVRIHNTQDVIYINKNVYDKNPNIINPTKKYKIT